MSPWSFASTLKAFEHSISSIFQGYASSDCKEENKQTATGQHWMTEPRDDVINDMYQHSGPSRWVTRPIEARFPRSHDSLKSPRGRAGARKHPWRVKLGPRRPTACTQPCGRLCRMYNVKT